jgi:serine/threonine protein kinase
MPADTPRKPPRRIQHKGQEFRVGRELGHGAFSRVYECTDEWRNRLAAKVIVPRDRSYEEARDDWLRELDNLTQLRHPNITYVHAAFECDRTFFIIVERCSLTLREFIENTGEPADGWLLEVAGDILQGLEFIHNKDYVHKDLHAGNVLVSETVSRVDPEACPEFTFKIGDLGISKLEEDIQLYGTIMAQWMLPPEYLDPHQFGVLGKQVDIYHAGLLLLALLTGTNPSFTRAEILEGKPRYTAESLPGPYAEVIAKALRRHVHQRTPSAIQFWRELRDASEQVD